MRVSLALVLFAVTACDGPSFPPMGEFPIPEERICPVPNSVAAFHMGAPIQIEEVQIEVGPFPPNARLFLSAGVTGDESIEAMANEHGYVTVSLARTPQAWRFPGSLSPYLLDFNTDSFVMVGMFEVGPLPTGVPFYLTAGFPGGEAIAAIPDLNGEVTVSFTVSLDTGPVPDLEPNLFLDFGSTP